MCGIVGYIGDESASQVLLDGLKRLEYRGYDSSGIATIHNGSLGIRRSVGKLVNLEKIISENPLGGKVGIGHTRWATHGKPNEENAHPHVCCKESLVVVHNGIIENYAALKERLIAEGHRFRSETDTEVLVHLFEKYFSGDLLEAVLKSLREVQGAYALAVISKDDPDRIIVARNDCPLVIGLGEKSNFVASDIPAILHRTREVMFLENGELADIRQTRIDVVTMDGTAVAKKIQHITWNAIQAEKAGYKHFMLKEIHEQPETVRDTFRGRLRYDHTGVCIDELDLSDKTLGMIQKVVIVACGTSYHAALIGKFFFEELGNVSGEVDIASEFRYRAMPLDEKVLFIAISQSGETADTLAALREAKRRGCATLAVCNVIGSSLAREAQAVFFTHCGPEIGVASTKAFTGQLVALYLLALFIAVKMKRIPAAETRKLLDGISRISHEVNAVLKIEPEIEKIARTYYTKNDFLYLGRHVNFPVALEGALKLKEISYIHAEGYPAGEMKHGPIALIDEHMPILAIATRSKVYDKIISNIEEAKARGGIILSLATEGDAVIQKISDQVLFLPQVDELLSPIVNIIPLQLLAYHIAVLRGCDVDQPRNLAKSVTVE